MLKIAVDGALLEANRAARAILSLEEEEPPPLISQAETDLNVKMADFEAAKDEFAATIGPLRNLKEKLRQAAMAVKDEAVADQTVAMALGLQQLDERIEIADIQREGERRTDGLARQLGDGISGSDGDVFAAEGQLTVDLAATG